MPFFNGVQAAEAAKRTVFLERLVFLDFEGDPLYAWTGFGDLVLYSQTWQGAGLIGTIGEMPVSMNDGAGKVELRMSGVSSDVVSMAKEQAAVRDRAATIWGQFFDEDLQPLDDRFFLPPKVKMDVMSFGGVGPSQRSVTLILESIFSGRNGAVQGLFSDRDQKLRSPGDKGLERISMMVPGIRRTWPRFT